MENILLSDQRKVKLSDFGFAFKNSCVGEGLRRTHCGSYSYVAPEILRRQSYEAKKADVWSLLVLITFKNLLKLSFNPLFR